MQVNIHLVGEGSYFSWEMMKSNERERKEILDFHSSGHQNVSQMKYSITSAGCVIFCHLERRLER